VGRYELTARRLDGIVGYREQDELGATRRLARFEDGDRCADSIRGALGSVKVRVSDSSQTVAGTCRERAERGSHLAGSDDGDGRPLAPFRHGCAFGSLLDAKQG
jgi:hypothetical protein